jgi:hypothetical protein
MTAAALVPSSAIRVSAETPTEALGEAIAALAARIHAATYELLVMLREFDARGGWNNGFLSCAHWLHWRTGIDLGAAREKVRVARALSVLPLVSAAMARGQVSYAKVRAITRVASPESEQKLLDLALAGTAAHVERVVRAWRRIDRVEAARRADARHLGRELSVWVDDDGMVVMRARFAPEAGAVVQRALQAAADQLLRESGGLPKAESLCDESTAAQRRADALVRVAEAALAGDLVRGSAPDRYQVVLHVAAPAVAAAGCRSVPDANEQSTPVLEINRQVVDVSAETSRRVGCDASVVVVHHGLVLDIGRRTRIVPTPMRRALDARDGGCRFPGCTSRYCDAHHIAHWADGGPTSLDNLVLLCRRHHRLVHEGRYSIVRHDDGAIVCLRPDGTVFGDTPRLHDVERDALVAMAVDDIPVWDGTPLDLDWAVGVLAPRGSSPASSAPP